MLFLPLYNIMENVLEQGKVERNIFKCVLKMLLVLRELGLFNLGIFMKR